MKLTKALLRKLIKEEVENKLLKEELDAKAVAQRLSLAIAAKALGPKLRAPLEQTGADIVAMHGIVFKGGGTGDPTERLKKLANISTDEEVQAAHNALYKMATGEDEATKKYAKKIRQSMPVWAEEGSLPSRLSLGKGLVHGMNRVKSPQDLIKWYMRVFGGGEKS